MAFTLNLHNDPRMFTAGNVKIDGSSSVNLYAKLLAQKQAKEDAMDEYVRNLTKGINPTGLRNSDRPAFDKLYQDYQNFAMGNKDAIRKRQGGADIQLQQKYQDLMNLVAESKQREEQKKPLVDILTDPNKRKNLNDDVFEHIQNHDAPLYATDAKGNLIRNEKSRAIDITGDMFKEPSFDYPKFYEGVSKGMQREKVRGGIISKDPVTGTVDVSYEEKFTPQQVQQIAANATRALADNPDNYKYYTKRLHNIVGTKEYDDLNQIYADNFGGKPQVRPDGKIIQDMIDSPEKLAAAEAAKQAMSLTSKGTEKVLDRDLANQRAINKIYISQAGSGKTKEVKPLDLREYRVVPGKGRDITELMQGVKVTGLPNGNSLLAKAVYYDPETQKVTYQEFTTRDEDKKFIKGGEKTVSLQTFLQNIKSNNPQADMTFLDGLWNPILNSNTPTAAPKNTPTKVSKPKKDPLGLF